jgi:HEAT repeat protein
MAKLLQTARPAFFPAGILLLASGDVRYMDAARRAAYASAAKDFDKIDYSHWAKGYGGVQLAEYFLATGDSNVLAKIKEIADSLAKGQMRCGSWGHNGPSGGYGAMNQAGVICAMAMVLAIECGVEVDRVALNKALNFFGKYAELGAVPYGDHTPGSRAPDDNGKSASSAVLFSLLPERQAEMAAFSGSVALSYASRETGHTGGYFSMLWGPLACEHAGRDALHTFMDNQAWYYNLSRTWKGALVLLPYQEALTRFDGSSYNDAGGEFTAGGMGLAFALPAKRLRILGAPRSVFGAQIKGDLLKARELYKARDWDALDKMISGLESATAGDMEKQFTAQLKAAGQMMRATRMRTIKEINNNIVEGDVYLASEQYQSLKKMWGVQDSELDAIGTRLATEPNPWYTREGKQFYDAWRNVRIAALKSWVPYYGEKARLLSWDPVKLSPRMWEDIASTFEIETNTWRVLLIEPAAGLPRGWEGAEFDDSKWLECAGLTGTPVEEGAKPAKGKVVLGRRSFVTDNDKILGLRLKLRSGRNAITDVYLNGVQVANVVRGQRSGYANIDLDEGSRGLIRKGTNILAVTSTEQGSGGNALDAGLQAVFAENTWDEPVAAGSEAEGPQDGMAVHRPLPSLPEKQRISRSDQLKVGEALKKFNADLEARYDAMSIEALASELESPVAYRRYLAESALVRKGQAGLEAAVKGLADKNWRVRSASCNVLAGCWSGCKDKSDETAVSMKENIPELIALVGDSHFWVRYCAVNALSAFGMDAGSAAPALVKAATDSEDWVRGAAIKALGKITDEPAPVLAAARAAMLIPSTSFSIVEQSLDLIKKNGQDDKASIPALISAIENPGEGMGANVVVKVMEQLVALDADKAVPVLARVAEGGYAYDRLAGDPRGKAIEMLGGFGSKSDRCGAFIEEDTCQRRCGAQEVS